MTASAVTQASGLEQEYYDNFNLAVARGAVDGYSTLHCTC